MNERLAISKLSPLRARYYDYKHFTYPWHFHSEYEIIYIKEGSGVRFVGNTIHPYSEGDIILLGPNLPHYMKSDDIYLAPENDLRVKGTILQFKKEFMHYSIHHYPHFIKIRNLLEESRQGIYFPETGSRKLVTLLEAIPREKGMDQFISFLQLLKQMSITKSRQIISTSDIPELPFYKRSRIDKVISFLNTHYTRRMDLEEISSLAAMNPAAFCSFFKREHGKTFKKYILDMRIGYACKLLLIENRSISQISTECGFETIPYFNKVFKRSIGYTPSEYKANMLSD
ncbi:MAG: AraC family transcriptional regulator [Bacteroides sp.]|nr:AraC family transcriptional regulator [Bacteroides sp.]